MTAADQIRALADTGTPGPWESDDGSAMWAEHGAEEGPYNYVGSTEHPVDAAKIVAAVNALPKVADLIAAIDEQPLDSDPGPESWEHWWLRLAAARDALVAALGVTP